MSGKTLLCAVASVMLFAGNVSAVTRTVHKSLGPYYTVNDALAAAIDGDVIEITDNSSTFTESLYVTKNNITIQGQAGLDPKPAIQGVKVAHPLADSIAAPQLWYWNAGMPNTGSRIFDTYGAAVINAADSLTLRNLSIKCEPTSSTTGTSTTGLLDFRFGDNGLVEDCYLDGSGINTSGNEVAGADRATLTAHNHTFRNCYFYRGNITLEHEGLGTLTLQNCVTMSPVHSIYIYGGTALIENTSINYLRASSSATAVEVGNAYGDVDATFRGCSFRKVAAGSTADMFGRFYYHDRTAAAGADTYASGRWSTGTIECEYDNCDFIGFAKAHTRAFDMGTGSGRINWTLKKFRVVDCNFYNICGPIFNAGGDVPFPGNHYQLPGSQDIFEDYNCYKLCMNTAILTGVRSGGHSVDCEGQPMYVDPAGNDYRLAANCPGATLNSTGTPAYTGSYGVSAVTVPATGRTIARSGGDFTTIQSALTAAQDGEVLTITDNSAPWVEALDFSMPARGAMKAVVLQGDPSLDPRPTLLGNGIPKPFLFTYGPGTTVQTHNMVLRNLVFDGTNTSGTNSTIFENFTTQTVMKLQNCKFIGGAGTLWGVNVEDNHTIMENCEITKPYAPTSACAGFLKRKSRNVAMTNCSIVSGDQAVRQYGGKLLAHDCTFVGAGTGSTILVEYNSTYSTTEMLEFYDTLVRSLALPGTNQPLIRYNASGTHRRNLVLDNCDLIGSLQGYSSIKPSSVAIDLYCTTTLVYANVVDTNFFNFGTTGFDLHGMTNGYAIPGSTWDPKLGFEDYNVYKECSNTLDAQGCLRGAHDVYLGYGAALYSNMYAGDFRISPSSAAATLNSTGTPPYSGSQGIGTEVVTACRPDWSLFQ